MGGRDRDNAMNKYGLFSYIFLDSPQPETYLRDMSDVLTIPAKNLPKLALAPTGGEGWVRGPLRARNSRNSDSLHHPLTPALSPGGGEGVGYGFGAANG
jgi:hypothetical protein